LFCLGTQPEVSVSSRLTRNYHGPSGVQGSKYRTPVCNLPPCSSPAGPATGEPDAFANLPNLISVSRSATWVNLNSLQPIFKDTPLLARDKTLTLAI